MAENAEVSFVTKKALVSFTYRVALFVHGEVVDTHAVICEYQAVQGRGDHTPSEMLVVGLPNGRKLEKPIRLHVGYNTVSAVAEIEE